LLGSVAFICCCPEYVQSGGRFMVTLYSIGSLKGCVSVMVSVSVVALHMYLVVSAVMFTYLNVNGSVLSNGVVLKFPIILALML